MLIIIPKCTECKTEDHVKLKHAWTDDGVGFYMAYCEKCYAVMWCGFSVKVLSKEEAKEIDNDSSNKKGWGRSYSYKKAKEGLKKMRKLK